LADKVTIDLTVEEKQALNAINKVIKSTKALGVQAEKTGKQTSTAFATFKGFLGAQAATKGLELLSGALRSVGNGIAAVVETSRGFEDVATQFTTLTQSADLAKDTIQELADFSARTPFRFEEIAQAGKSLLSFQFQAEELVPLLQQLGDVAAGVGTPLRDLTQVFGQVASAGKLTGERLLQFQERGVPIVKALAEEMGVLESEVRDMVSGSKVSFDIFQRAFARLSAEGGQFFEGMIRQSKTTSGVLSTLADNFTLVEKEIGDAFLPSLKEGALAIIEFTRSHRDLIAELAKKFGEQFLVVTRAIIVSTQKAIAFAEEHAESLKTLAKGFIELTKHAGLLRVAFELWSKVFSAVASGFEILLGVMNDFSTGLKDGLIRTLLRATEVFGFLISTVGDIAFAVGLESLGDAFRKLGEDIGFFSNQGIIASDNARKLAKEQGELAKFADSAAGRQKALADVLTTNAITAYSTATEGAALFSSQVQSTTTDIDAQVKAVVDANKKFVESERAKQAELDAMKEARKTIELEEQDLELAERQVRDEEELQRIADVLGQEEAIRAQAEINTLLREKKFLQALRKQRALKEKAEKSSIFAIQKFEEISQKQRFENIKSTLGSIQALTSTGSKKLFFLNKASQVAIATIDGITAVQKALASVPFPASIGAAALVGGLAAANVARIAATPPPAFQDGGIVPGPTSLTDNAIASVAGGELILNRRQQGNLFDLINRGVPEGASGDLEGQISNLTDAVLGQEIVVQIGEAEFARAIRDTSRAGFALT
jgi:tape measure domain-containing protein